MFIKPKTQEETRSMRGAWIKQNIGAKNII